MEPNSPTNDFYAQDFGKHVRESPLAAFRPRSAEEVAEIVREAAAKGIPVVARGQGHTTGGQSLRRGGWVIDTALLSHTSCDGEYVRCGAGALWSNVVRTLAAQGRAVPVLTDYLDLSVGGTLSVGGVGGQSFRYGLQVDQLVELVVVDGQGRIHVVSEAQRPELFHAARGGLGRLGIIVEAKLRTTRAPEVVHVWALPYPALGPFLADQVRLTGDSRFGYLVGNFIPGADGWRFSLEAVEFAETAGAPQAKLDDLACDANKATVRTLRYLDYVLRLEQIGAAMKASGACHPWADVFLPASVAEAFIGDTLKEFGAEEVGAGYVMTYPLRTSVLTAPLINAGTESHAFLYDALPSIPQSQVSAWVERSTRWSKKALECGGGIYPIGSAVLESADWQRQLRAWHARIRELKAEYDPKAILAGAL